MKDSKIKIDHYRSMLLSKGNQAHKNTTESIPESNDSVEFAGESLSEQKINNAMQLLTELADQHPDKASQISSLNSNIEDQGKKLLHALDVGNTKYFDEYPDSFSLLEVLVRTDGSRPSYLIKNGKIDFTSSPRGEWEGILAPNLDRIHQALDCVGRVEVSGEHIGSGFLVARNLIATNRHVLQALATQKANGEWILNPDSGIDFGREYKGIDSLRPRKFEKVVFSGDAVDPRNIDHNKLDLVFIALVSCAEDQIPRRILGINSDMNWSDEGRYILTAGYPADPGTNGLGIYGTDVLNLLFKLSYGKKRLAPGQIIPSQGITYAGRVVHDASTLAGNSGSVILALGAESLSAGIHYGGKLSTPRENWGHILANYLERKLPESNITIKECLEEYEVSISPSN